MKTIKTDFGVGCRAIYLSHNHYYVSDKTAGMLAKTTNRKKLPSWGYEVTVILPNGEPATLARTTNSMFDAKKLKRGWVWTVRPELTFTL